MKENIKLYIADTLVDTEDISLPITYQTEDLSNPTAVKNSFSKTITLKGTKNNNKIFNYIYDTQEIVNKFDPSKRVDFKIFNGSDLVESGYMQLNTVSVNNQDIEYSITLYGGLGDFFYNLKYKEDGELKKLKDLNWPVEQAVFNKDLIYKSFNKDWSNDTGSELTDYIAFIPAYNGLYTDFDSSKVLINTYGQDVFTDTYDGYSSVDGYILGNLNKDYTEWELKELRSYKQRPAIKVSRLINNILDNSGYEVNLDDTFFNSNNPYWAKSFITLPILENSNKEQEANIDTTISDNIVYDKYTSKNQSKEQGTVDYTNYSGIGTVGCEFSFSLQAIADGPKQLYFSQPEAGYQAYQAYSRVTAQLKAYNNDNLIGYSEIYSFNNYCSDIEPSKDNNIWGNFIKKGDKYIFTSNTNETEFTLRISGLTKYDSVKYVLETKWYGTKYCQLYYMADYISPDESSKYVKGIQATLGIIPIKCIGTINYKETYSSSSIVSITDFLDFDKTPCDFILDYAKLFGLYFIKDIESKTISILTRNTFFKNKVNNIDSLIDYSKDFSITPILFDHNYYTLVLDTTESYYKDKYEDTYDQVYGQQRISTGYNFNSENKSLYDDSIYLTAMPVIDSDKYYRQYYNYSGKLIPSFIADNVECTYYKDDTTTSKSYYAYNILNPNATNELNIYPGNDCWIKSCFFSLDSDTRSAEDGAYCFVFYNGLKDCLDVYNNPVEYSITDDLTYMGSLNDNTPCWLYSYGTKDKAGNVIAIKTSKLPQYVNLLIDNNTVTDSFDFGAPQITYTNTFTYDESKTIYSRFWKAFYQDQFDVNTRKVTCFVKFDRLNQDSLREFYWFNNSIWILNKIDSYDITSFNTVRCEFIKVVDINDYIQGQTIWKK